MSINYKIKLYYCIIGGPYHCHHHHCSHHCCQPLSFSSSHSLMLTLQLCPHPPHHGFILVQVASPRCHRCCSHPEGLWQVIIGVWYKNLKAEHSSHAVWSGLFGSHQMDNGVSNCQILWFFQYCYSNYGDVSQINFTIFLWCFWSSYCALHPVRVYMSILQNVCFMFHPLELRQQKEVEGNLMCVKMDKEKRAWNGSGLVGN